MNPSRNFQRSDFIDFAAQSVAKVLTGFDPMNSKSRIT
jgi:hypothetical protein